jgi:ADP-ribose pyrophosphatase YjhB (NUDIX family)
VIRVERRLIIASQVRHGCRRLSLPGGRVNARETVLDALKREVAEETGLDVVPRQLLYVSENVESVRIHELELIFLAESEGVPALGTFETVDLDADEFPDVHPAILGEIVTDARTDWRDTPRWLGNLRRPPAEAE